jgi:hypothetical protein
MSFPGCALQALIAVLHVEGLVAGDDEVSLLELCRSCSSGRSQ